MYSKIIFFILLPIIAFTQAPQKINFQSILRNTNGEVVSNKSVSLKISILSGSISGSSVYGETHTKTTDASGLISLHIGNGTVLSGIFADIAWGDFPHFIKLEADFSGGSNYVFLGTQELMSVPYALYASKTDTSSLNLVNRFSSKVNIADTSSMLTNYRTGLNSKVNIADTSNMLNPYLRKASIQNSTLELFGIHSWEYPEGFSKEFVIISDDNLPYTVPSGKNLYTFPQHFNPIVDNTFYPNGSGSFSYLFKEGTIITSMQTDQYGFNMAFGFLVKKTNNILPVNAIINSTNLTYTVPIGKILFVKSGPSIQIDNRGAVLYWSGFGIPIMEGAVIKVNSIWDGFNSMGFTGYLLDK